MIGIYDIERIYSENGTMQIVRSNNNRDTKCGFVTRDEVLEWDEIIVENDYETREFAGILDSPSINFSDNQTVYKTSSSGYRKIFDREQVSDTWEATLAGDIVRDIVTDLCPGFSIEGIEDGTLISRVVFNNVLPSEAIQRIANATGYRWYIDFYKVVHFVANDSEEAPEGITDDGSFWENLQINIDVSNLINVVIVRGGTYLSEEVVYTEVADGEKTQFVLPERPHDVSVYVNSVEKTVGIQFGESAATQEFQINFNEKYIENGTHATLSEGDILEVRYKYDVPIRVRRKNLGSIALMQSMFPETSGEFIKIVNDKSIDSRDLAYNIAQQELNKDGARRISGSFNTVEDIFSPGQIIPLNKGSFAGSAVIQKITSKHVTGTLWRHTVSFATVLFGFEEFMRELYAARKVELIDGETLETSTDLEDSLTVTDTVVASVDQNRRTESIEVDDEVYTDLNAGIEFVFAPYFPSDFTDTYRVFLLDNSVLS